ncbi:ANTAR domain-containing protein [Streptomyces sp. NPDC046465]|uniref:ANTAR domain-containing protein n=1 Tax=Streptomyces sp. NPDC046465 TaxID=3155810 RepID=UPI0033D330B9
MNEPEHVEQSAKTVAHLVEQVGQLKRAVVSHATVDQAIGVVVALGRISPEQGWDVLQEVSQHTNTKLRSVADLIVAWGQGGDLPPEVRSALAAGLAKRTDASSPDAPVE